METSVRIQLVKPSQEHLEDIRLYRQEFFENGGNFNGDSGLRKFEDISAWLLQCRLMENKETLPNPDWVEAEQFILVQEGTTRVLGMINFRHYLNEYLAQYGGHIGYGIRPSERRKGYAKGMLLLCLEHCCKRGLEKVMLSCYADNEASRRTILACGGKYEETVWESTGEKWLEKYWITL